MKANLRKALAFALTLTITMIQVTPAFAVDTIESGVKATCDEAYYATMDYYGNLLDGSVVKSYIVNGQDSILDYGNYEEVINLTDSTKAQVATGQAKFSFKSGLAPSHFYFEGKTAEPFYALPWTTEIHYRHNGVMAEAQDLAGQSGMFDIMLDFIPNENASEYAKNNYVMAATAMFNQDDILSFEAEGAQVQLVGNLRMVLFMVLPGEEQHFMIRVGSEDFSFGGMSFLIVPATLEQLKMISDINEKKDSIEENYELLNSSLDTLLDSLTDMSSSLYESADGLDELNEGRSMIAENRDSIYNDLDEALVSLETLDTAIAKMPAHMETAEKVADQTHSVLKDMSNTTDDLHDALKDMKSDMNSLKSSLGNLKNKTNITTMQMKALSKKADALKDDYDNLIPLLADLQLKIGGDELTLNPMVGNAQASITMGALKAQLAGTTAEDVENLRELKLLYSSCTSSGATEMDENTFLTAALVASGYTETEATTTLTQIFTISSNIAAVKAANPSLTDDQAKAYVYNAAGMSATDIAKYEAGVTKINSLKTIYAYCRAQQAPTSTMNEDEFVAAMVYASKTGTADAVTFGEAFQAAALADLAMSNANLSDCIGMLGSTGLGGSTADMLSKTSEVVDDLASLSGTAKDLLEEADDLLDSVEDLQSIESKNFSELKSTLTDTKDALKALSGTLSSSRRALTTLETTLKNAGKKINSGAQKSLEGIAKSLRSAANSLSKTTNIKTAKSNISSSIENLWNDYTGDVNRFLLMDACAPMQSLTDSRNDSPTSIQIVMRSQEIKVDDDSDEMTVPGSEATTFWQRIANMFHDIADGITGLFN